MVYTYQVQNIGSTPVTGGVLTDKVNGVDVVNPISFTLNAGETQTFTSQATITQNTTNVATATGNNGGQCTASDTVTVHVACLLGYPFTDPNYPRASVAFPIPSLGCTPFGSRCSGGATQRGLRTLGTRELDGGDPRW